MQIIFTKRKIPAIYIGLAIVSMLLAGVSYARAQEPMGNPGMGSRETQAGLKETRKATLSVDLQNRFINLVRNAANRMDGAIVRLEGIHQRIEARISILESEGVDTSGALAPLSDAKNKLAEAKSKLVQVKANAEAGLVSETPRERFAAARQEFSQVRQAIRDSYILTREAVAELKDAVIEANLNNNGRSDAVRNTLGEPTSTN